jgi:hypothetical protein
LVDFVEKFGPFPPPPTANIRPQSEYSKEQKEVILDKLISELEGMGTAPYRSMTPPAPKPISSYGLIVQSPQHRCSLPGFWTRFWYRLRGTPLAFGSLYRCSRCGTVYRYLFNEDFPYTTVDKWGQTTIQEWIGQGGTE